MLMMVKCDRCNGTGTTVWKHIEGGICFKCRGAKVIHVSRVSRVWKKAN
jgi:DnaJ-class molecular chaperone